MNLDRFRRLHLLKGRQDLSKEEDDELIMLRGEFY